MAEISNNPPLINPIAVVGSQFCAANPVDLTISKVSSFGANNFSFADVDGNIIFKMKASNFSLHQRRVLHDPNDVPLLFMQAKVMSLHSRWKVYRGDSSDRKDLLFTVKQSSWFQLKIQLDVFLAGNTKEEVCDFKIKGNWSERSCKIYVGESSNLIAQMHRKSTHIFSGKENFMVTVYPNVDYAFVVTLIFILNEICESYDAAVASVV